MVEYKRLDDGSTLITFKFTTKFEKVSGGNYTVSVLQYRIKLSSENAKYFFNLPELQQYLMLETFSGNQATGFIQRAFEIIPEETGKEVDPSNPYGGFDKFLDKVFV